MRGMGFLLFIVIGGVLVWMLTRTRPFLELEPAYTLPGLRAQLGIGDQAVAVDITTGSGWYDYWRRALSGAYIAAGVMPPEGPLVACIVAPCPGTPVPQSP